VATIVYRRKRGLWHFSRRLNNGDEEEHSREAERKHHLLVKKDHNYLRSYLTENLALVWITLVGGSNED
jgi:hypothetical protein